MKKLFVTSLIFLVLLSFSLAYAADESITVSSTVVTLTAGNYGTFTNALIYVETNPIRFTLDGSTPPVASGVGIRLEVGQNLYLPNGRLISNFRAIRDTGADGKINVCYW